MHIEGAFHQCFLATFDILQEIIDITLELETIYHERKKENGGHREKNPSILITVHPQKNFNRIRIGITFKAHNIRLIIRRRKVIGSEKERIIKKGLCTYCGGKHTHEKFFKRNQNRTGYQRFPYKLGKIVSENYDVFNHHEKKPSPPVEVVWYSIPFFHQAQAHSTPKQQ
ncbi:hypothetical protein O181_101515 [Austropuccinia psidii MF-1]|uniref:Uncharacterized protein n=1 Tax=Austropuccinia psidii MF-1 TaxID=1389203 RepID=A0A9Q3PHU7_9BASI|nr:hypothetical protein [Austropuccinia psidii MF-1]